MTTLLTIVHVCVCLFLVGIVLLQHGKGADVGASFGGSGGQSLFGSEGPLPLLNKITTAAAIIFMLTSVTLALDSSKKGTGTVMSDIAAPQQPVAVEAVESGMATEDIIVPVTDNKIEVPAVPPVETSNPVEAEK